MTAVDQPGIQAPPRSSFVTVVGWIFIVLSGFSTLIGALQNLMIRSMPFDQLKSPLQDSTATQLPCCFWQRFCCRSSCSSAPLACCADTIGRVWFLSDCSFLASFTCLADCSCSSRSCRHSISRSARQLHRTPSFAPTPISLSRSSWRCVFS